ncbi:amidase [Streptomyces sioyaensis]|uniref:Amidase n=1 Tax=Streptomyces sioyaensis TaxID=67364 RepID=A0A4Q1R1Y9_9ACTN|nr:amidase [Streptomyces sioyaensis]MBM4794503.1 amidase [Streptomyces sioyaensis]RXS64863.1 amidase [Streptomyces sioyaensis]
MQPYELTLAGAAAAIRAGELSPVELTASVLGRIGAVEDRLGAYVTLAADSARRSAVRAEREIAAGRHRGPLHGIPFGLKDLIDAAGLPTTASSRVGSPHPPATDSAVAARLSAAGAVLLGKTHTHEFGYGLTTPQTRNARDHARIAGGSSGGSAVAVAAGAATFALGTDTGGSIRVPAALNGVVGLKPTYGLLPLHGVTSLSWSLDHVGPLTRTVEDAALVLTALVGRQGPPGSPGTASTTAPTGRSASPAAHGADLPPPESADLTGLRIGVPRQHYFERVDPGVETSVRAAIGQLHACGAELMDIDIPMARYLQATHWGLMVPEATAAHEQTLRSVPELYGEDVRVLLEAGALVPAGDYLRAQRSRALMREAWTELFQQVDVVAAPSVPMAAVRAEQQTVQWPDGTAETVSDAYVRLCAPANITGIPALSLPVAPDGTGLPAGLQLMGRPFDEATLLRVGRAYETASGSVGGPVPVAA